MVYDDLIADICQAIFRRRKTLNSIGYHLPNGILQQPLENVIFCTLLK